MEGISVEDEGDGVCFCVYAYNVQPGIVIDYATGESSVAPESAGQSASAEEQGTVYILNTGTMKFHYPTCSSVASIQENNRQEFTGTREEALAQGYAPCGRCKP